MRKPQLSGSDSLEVKMTPMIDVVFLLLIFFIWTSSFELPEFDLPSAIAEPPAGGSEVNPDQAPPVEAFEEIVVKVSARDVGVRLELNGREIATIADLKRRIGEILALGVQPPVIVDPADEIKMSAAVEVYDAVRAAGADRVLFAVRS